MKRLLSIFAMAFALVATAVSCADDLPELKEELALSRCLVPTELNAKITNGQVVQFSWTKSKGASLFVLELYNDEAKTDLFESFNVSVDEVPYTVTLEADRTFYARVRAVDETGVLQDSKWADFENAIVTTAVKSNMFLEFAAKTSESVTVKWEASDDELERIEWAVGETVEKRDLTAEEIAAGEATITGLQPATSYTVSIWYKSANRGEVVALTDPNLDGYTEVADLAAFQSALAAKAPKIYLKAAGSPYEIAAYDLAAGVEIVGEQGVDGSRPVIIGEFHIADGYDGAAIRFESVELNGQSDVYGFALQLKNGGAEDKTVESILFKNCNITGYSKGLFYEWGKKLTTTRLAWDGCTIYDVNKSFENGGDGIDFRNASDIKSFEVINNTVYNGFRTFLRLDAALVVGDLKIENNTFMNVSCNAGNANGNNSGLMGIKCKPATATFKNNLVLNMPDGCGLTRKAAANLTPSDLGMVYSNNHFYNVGATFFSDTDAADQNNRVSQAEALAGGGSILSADPCYNAKGGVFNLTNQDLITAKVGAPQWQVIFVEKEEDLTLPCLEGAHTWNFNDAKYFTGTVEKPRVRDCLLMSAADNKLAIADGCISFSGVTPTKKGVPTDGYVAFKVNQPGSVYINAKDAEGLGNHLVVAVGPVDGSVAAVKGGAVANADNTTNQKILISDITEESLVYVYASGPISLSALAWALDVRQVNTALDTPAPEVEPGKIDQGEAAEAVVTWAPVENAGSYSVVFSGKTYVVEEGTSYTISPDVVKFLDAGSYKVEVYANPAEGDIYNTQSSAGVAVLTIAAKAAAGDAAEFVVSSAEDLLNAISSGKSDITLAYSSTPYELGTVNLTAPLRLTGQKSGDAYTPIVASFKLTGNVQALILRNLDIDGTAAEGAVIIDDKEAAADENGYQVVADTVAIYDSYIHDGAARLYDNSGKSASCVQNVIFSGIHVDNYSAGNDMIDFRAGHYHKVLIVNSTFSNCARTFMRTDAGSEINYLTVRNNTFYKVATNSSSKDNNGLFHVRGTAGSGMLDYRIMNNMFYSILLDTAPEHANGYPKFISKNSAALKPNVISNNYFYNIEEREDKTDYSWWTVNCSREEGLAGNGVVLPADPCKDAANGDYTLVNAVAMNSNIGDPRWNPMRGSNPTSEISVENVTDLLTAISAGKKAVTLKAGTYDLSALTDVAEVSGGKLTIVNSLALIGEEGAKLVGSFVLSGDAVGSFSVNGLEIEGINDYLITMDENSSVGSVSLKNTTVVKTGGLIYGAKNKGAALNTLELSGCHFDEVGTKDFIDFRDGTTLNAVRIVNNTFANGIRTFARIDANCACSSINVRNNTFYNLCFTDSKDNNGIFHVRATTMTSEAFVVSKNIFASMHREADAPSQANGYPKLVSTNAANVIPTFTANYYYDVETEGDYCWWTKDRVTAEVALGGYGVVLTEDPFKAAATGDFTLVNALAISEKVGDQCWNPNQTVRPDDWFTVTTADELLMAISAGKQNVELAYGTYDFTSADIVNEAVANGKITLAASLNLKGKTKDGKKPEFIGGFQFSGEMSFSATAILFNGNGAVDNFAYVTDGAAVASVTFRNCEVTAYKNRMFYQDKEASVTSALNITGNLVYDMGTSGDFIDIRKGTLDLVNVKNNTFSNGMRTFLRMDANVVCGAVTVENNTFYNLCSADSKDNNGIFHVRSTALSASAYIVKNNIFASMHKAEGAPTDTNGNGFPKLLATNAASQIPTFINNYYYDVDTADAATSWFTPGKRAEAETPVSEADVTAYATANGGAVLAETPFAGDPTTGKFTVTVDYKGYGDPRW